MVKAFIVLTEDKLAVPTTKMVDHNGFDTGTRVFCSLWALRIYAALTCMQVKQSYNKMQMNTEKSIIKFY